VLASQGETGLVRLSQVFHDGLNNLWWQLPEQRRGRKISLKLHDHLLFPRKPGGESSEQKQNKEHDGKTKKQEGTHLLTSCEVFSSSG
jgi:hypothetical protein